MSEKLIPQMSEPEDDGVKEEPAGENSDEFVDRLDRLGVDKETVEKVGEVIENARKKFWQSSIIRFGVVLVAYQTVNIAGKLLAEKLRYDRKKENEQ